MFAFLYKCHAFDCKKYTLVVHVSIVFSLPCHHFWRSGWRYWCICLCIMYDVIFCLVNMRLLISLNLNIKIFNNWAMRTKTICHTELEMAIHRWWHKWLISTIRTCINKWKRAFKVERLKCCPRVWHRCAYFWMAKGLSVICQNHLWWQTMRWKWVTSSLNTCTYVLVSCEE